MPVPYWQRPWNDGAREHYDEGEPDPPTCETCGREVDPAELFDGVCDGCAAKNEDAGIDQYYEDSQSPSVEDYEPNPYDGTYSEE